MTDSEEKPQPTTVSADSWATSYSPEPAELVQKGDTMTGSETRVVKMPPRSR